MIAKHDCFFLVSTILWLYLIVYGKLAVSGSEEHDYKLQVLYLQNRHNRAHISQDCYGS